MDAANRLPGNERNGSAPTYRSHGVLKNPIFIATFFIVLAVAIFMIVNSR